MEGILSDIREEGESNQRAKGYKRNYSAGANATNAIGNATGNECLRL